MLTLRKFMAEPALGTPGRKPVGQVELKPDHWLVQRGLIGYWPLTESSGSALINLSHPAGGATLSPQSSWAVDGRGVGISPMTSGVTSVVSSYPALDVRDAITLAAWGRVSTLGTQSSFSYIDRANFYKITQGWGGDIRTLMRVGGQQYNISTGSSGATLGAAYHVLATYSVTSRTIRLYVDGRLVVSQLLTGLADYRLDSTTAPTTLCRMDGGSDRVATQYDAAIFNQELTADEVWQYYIDSYGHLQSVINNSFATVWGVMGRGASLTTTPGTGQLAYGNAITGSAANLTTTPGTGQLAHGNAITGSAASLTTAPGVGILAHGNAISGSSASLTTTPGVGQLAHGNAITGSAASLTTAPGAGILAHGNAIAGIAASLTTAPGVGILAHGNAITGSAASLTTTPGAGILAHGNAIAGSAASLTTTPGTGQLAHGNAITGSAASLTIAPGAGKLAYGNAVHGRGSNILLFPSTGVVKEQRGDFVHMRKLFMLRQHLLNFPGDVVIEPDNLDVFADKGKIISFRGESYQNNHYQWNYSANVVIRDFGGNPDQLMFYILGWIDENQANNNEEAIDFEVDIINQRTVDISISIQLSEMVRVDRDTVGVRLVNQTEPDNRAPLLSTSALSITIDHSPAASA